MRLALIQTKQNELYQFSNAAVRYTADEAAALQQAMLKQNLRLMKQAADEGCDLIVTTEAINFAGDPRKVNADYMTLIDGSMEALVCEISSIARDGRCYVAAGLYSRKAPACYAFARELWPGVACTSDADDGLYNAIWLFNRQGEVCAVYHKTHLAGSENDYLVAGDSYCTVDTDMGRIGLAICWDMQFPETCVSLTLQGADLIIAPTWGWEWIYGPARAYENGVYVASAMAVPYDCALEGLRSPSEVIRPDGKTIVQGSRTEAQIVRCDIGDLAAYHDLKQMRMQGRRGQLSVKHKISCP